MLTLPRQSADDMVAHAREEDPNECCGILAGRDGQFLKLYRITNAEKSPYRYRMDPKEQYLAFREIEDTGWEELLAFYHSHTHSEAYPSPTDIRLAEMWPNAHYILVSLMDKDKPAIRAFRIENGRVTEEPVRITV